MESKPKLPLESIENLVRSSLPIAVKLDGKEGWTSPFVDKEALEAVIRLMSIRIKEELPSWLDTVMLFVDEIEIDEGTLPRNESEVVIYMANDRSGINAFYDGDQGDFILGDGQKISRFNVLKWKYREKGR